MRKESPRYLGLIFALSLFCNILSGSYAQAQLAAEKSTKNLVAISLVKDGAKPLPIVVSAQADVRVQKAAADLAMYLSRISGSDFQVHAGDGTSGIAVGTATDFPALKLQNEFNANDALLREEYLLRSHSQGLYIVGASDLAVEDAVWDLLYRLGYRQFFPGKIWEVVPHSSTLEIAIDAKEHPDYAVRQIWYGFGPLPERRAGYEEWTLRNRATGEAPRGNFELQTGHAWQDIVERHKAEFEAHPEYLCSNEPGLEKFCVSNPGLQKLVVNDALEYFKKNPHADMISMEPSDGGGWECEKCNDSKQFKNVSDRVVFLANLVVREVNKKYPGKYVGIYAYGFHSPPPTIRVDPHVVVSIATVFIRGGYTMEQLLEGWKKQGAQVFGIREYYSVNPWDRDLPGKALGDDLHYLQRTIPYFYNQGARFMTAESSDNWGPNGLGYYLASRMLWNVDAAKQINQLTDDFLEKAFGPAKVPMAEFYKLLDGSNKAPLSDDVIGKMFRALAKARGLTTDEKIMARLDDLALYAHYVELYNDYSIATAPARQPAFEQLLRFAYRIRNTGMIHTMALYRDLFTRDKNVVLPDDARWEVPEGKNPWKSSEPFTRAQIDEFVKNGVANHKLLDFEPKAFSDNLVPASALHLPDTPETAFNYTRDTQEYYVWIKNGQIDLDVTSGLIYQNLGDATISLYSPSEVTLKPVATATVPPDKQLHKITLKTPYSGLHRIEVNDTTSGTKISLPAGTPVVIESSMQHQANFVDRWYLYFYVPKGTKIVGGYRNGPGQVLDGDGKVVRDFEGWLTEVGEYFSIPVPPGQDGKVWKFELSGSKRILMTVPPYLARSAQELLIPQEVVEADSKP